MLLYACTIFTSAFLLFLVQPIIAKQILPWFGGSAAVWTTCLVFFQVALLAGYAYSDLTTRKLQTAHAGRSCISRCWRRASRCCRSSPMRAGSRPATKTRACASSACCSRPSVCPIFCSSTTGPLVQAWFARTFPQRHGLPPVRAVEPRVDAGADFVSVRVRTVGRDRDPGLRVVGGLRGVRAAVRGLRALQPAPRDAHAAAVRSSGAAAAPTTRPRRARSIWRCGSRCRRWARGCCSPSPITSRKTSRRFRSCGSRRSRSTC